MASSTKVRFLTGNSDNLNNSNKNEGKVYFAVEPSGNQGSIFFDNSSNQRIAMNTRYIDKKTYSGIYSTASSVNADNASFYFATVRPDDWYKAWHVKYEITSYIPNQNDYSGHFVVDVCGTQASLSAYAAFNSHYSSSSRTLYYHNLLKLNKTGFDADTSYGHALGIGLRNAHNPNSSSHPRTFTIKIIEAENCTVTMLNNLVLKAALPAYIANTAYYNGGLTEMNGATNGLQETGDSDNYYDLSLLYTYLKAGTNGIKQYSLIMEDNSGSWQSLTTTHGVSTGKIKNNVGFVLGHIYYYNNGNNLSSGSYTGYNQIRSKYSSGLIDLRYSTNCSTNLIANKPVYIKGSIGSDGLFYLSNEWYTQTKPTAEDGCIYIHIGQAYDGYRVDFIDGKIYWYKNKIFREYPDTGINIETTGTNGQVLISNGDFSPTWTSSANINAATADTATTATNLNDKPSTEWIAGTNAGPALIITAGKKISDATSIPSASSNASGIITTEKQEIKGKKTFLDTATYKDGIIASTKILTTSDLPYDTTTLAANGLAISSSESAKDMGWIRITDEPNNSGIIMEIATGKDGGKNEQIVARQYNASEVVKEVKILDTAGNSTFPGILKTNYDKDSTYSKDTAAALVSSGGLSVEKQLSAKSVRVDNNSSEKGCTMKFNTDLNCMEFIFD